MASEKGAFCSDDRRPDKDIVEAQSMHADRQRARRTRTKNCRKRTRPYVLKVHVNMPRLSLKTRACDQATTFASSHNKLEGGWSTSYQNKEFAATDPRLCHLLWVGLKADHKGLPRSCQLDRKRKSGGGVQRRSHRAHQFSRVLPGPPNGNNKAVWPGTQR